MRSLKQGGSKVERKEPYATQEEFNKRVVRYRDVPLIDLGRGPGQRSHIVSTEKVTISFGIADPNAYAAPHHHECEQIIIMTDGAIDEIVDGKLYHLEKGDVVILPPNTEHGGYTSGRGCSVIDIFSPPRQDLVVKLKAVG